MKSRSTIKKVFALGAGFLLSFGPFLLPSPVQADIPEIPGPGAGEVRLGAGATWQEYTLASGWLTLGSLKGTQNSGHPPALNGMASPLENTPSHKSKNIAKYAVVFKEHRLNDVARSFLEFFPQYGYAVLQ